MTIASIVTYNSSEEELDTLFKCVLQSNIKHIYLVDNSPTDRLKTYSTLSPKIIYIHGHGNIGYGAAHNIAIQKAIHTNAKYHIVLNPDISFENGTIEELTKYMNSNEDVGQVMPKIIYPNGDLQYLCKMFPTPLNLIGRRFSLSKMASKVRNDQYEMKFTNYNHIMDVPCLSGCFMFLRIETLEKVKGFDERFWMYCEDFDICRRIGNISRTVFNPNIKVVHYHKKESYTNKKLLLQHIISAVKYFNKWGWIFDSKRKKTNTQIIQNYNKKCKK